MFVKLSQQARLIRFSARQGKHIMRDSTRSSTISRLAGAAAALWLCGTGAAWAGGGQDLAGLQGLIGKPDGSTGICAILGMDPCPQLPTVTEAILELAGLANNLSEMSRAQDAIPPGSSVNADNAAAMPPSSNHGMPFPLDYSTTSPPLFVAATPGTKTTAPTPAAGLLSTLTPLAFVSQDPLVSNTAPATQLFDSTADTFLYAVGVSSTEAPVPGALVPGANLTIPDKVYFFLDDLFRTKNNSQFSAKFQFPLTAYNQDGSERAVPTTLQFNANSAGDCSTSTVTGDFNPTVSPSVPHPQTLKPDQIGVKCAAVFGPSPTLTVPHVIIEVAVKLLIAQNTDPAYFYSALNPGQKNPINTLIFTAFDPVNPPLGHTPAAGILGSQGLYIGLSPTPAPFCNSVYGTTTCPVPPPTPPKQVPFSFCASLPNNTIGQGAGLRPAVGAYSAMATSGEMLLSAALPSFSQSFCPPL
jgi:hypothetical protein